MQTNEFTEKAKTKKTEQKKSEMKNVFWRLAYHDYIMLVGRMSQNKYKTLYFVHTNLFLKHKLLQQAMKPWLSY